MTAMATRSGSTTGSGDFITLRLLGAAALIFSLSAPTLIVFQGTTGLVAGIVLYAGVALALAGLGKWLFVKIKAKLP